MKHFHAVSIRAAAALAALLLIVTLAANANAAPPAAPPPDAGAAVNVNSASSDQLMSLPGIGAAKAEAIVKYREEHGPYKQPEDLLQVRGIGEALLQKIRPHISIGAAKAAR
jgi:competence protein ComEA